MKRHVIRAAVLAVAVGLLAAWGCKDEGKAGAAAAKSPPTGSAATASTAPASRPVRRLFLIRENGKFAYIDRTGKVVLRPPFEVLGAFVDGMAMAQRPKTPGMNFGFIDTSGKMVIESALVNKHVEPKHPVHYGIWYSDGMVHIASPAGDRGFMDKTGRIVVKPQYARVKPFTEGMARVRPFDLVGERAKWGYIDKTGKMVIPPKFISAYAFSEGLASVAERNPAGDRIGGFIDKTGRYVIGPHDLRYRSYFGSCFSEGLARVYEADSTLQGKYFGFIDRTGKIVIPARFDYVEDFSEGLASVVMGFPPKRQCGYVDRTGKVVIPLRFEKALDFSEGLACVQLKGKWGYIDKTGRLVIPAQFSEALSFRGGLAVTVKTITKDDQTTHTHGYIDASGRYVWSTNEDYPLIALYPTSGRPSWPWSP